MRGPGATNILYTLGKTAAHHQRKQQQKQHQLGGQQHALQLFKMGKKKSIPQGLPTPLPIRVSSPNLPPSSSSSPSHKHTHTLSYLCNGRRRRTFLGGKTTRGKTSPSCGSPCTCCATVSSPRKTGEENPRATNLNSPTRTGFVLREPSHRERERERVNFSHCSSTAATADT